MPIGIPKLMELVHSNGHFFWSRELFILFIDLVNIQNTMQCELPSTVEDCKEISI
jgi:hypothetical protein